MLIQTEETPNLNALKFILDKSILDSEHTVDFSHKESAASSPLASALFDLDGVSRVFLGTDFIVVTKEREISWQMLRSDVTTIIMDFLLTGKPIMERSVSLHAMEMEVASDDEGIVSQIKQILDTEIRPAVARDGGDIMFYGYKDGSVYLRMRGSCQGCPSILLTLKHGVEVILRRHLPEIVSVEKVDL